MQTHPWIHTHPEPHWHIIWATSGADELSFVVSPCSSRRDRNDSVWCIAPTDTHAHYPWMKTFSLSSPNSLPSGGSVGHREEGVAAQLALSSDNHTPRLSTGSNMRGYHTHTSDRNSDCRDCTQGKTHRGENQDTHTHAHTLTKNKKTKLKPSFFSQIKI